MARIFRASILLLLIASIGFSNHFIEGYYFSALLTEQSAEDDTRGAEEVRISHVESRFLKFKESKPARALNTFYVVQTDFFPRLYISSTLLYLSLRVIRI